MTTKPSEPKKPWRSQEVLDIIGDNIYHDKLKHDKSQTGIARILLKLLKAPDGIEGKHEKDIVKAEAAIQQYMLDLLPKDNPRKWTDSSPENNTPIVAWTMGYEKAISELRKK